MAITSYSSLVSAIGDELNREDLSSVIPTWISLAEATFNRMLRHRRMLCRATAELDTQFTALPSDFLEAKNIQLNTSPVASLEFVTLEYADKLRQSLSGGTPRYYTILGDTIEVVPTPSTAQTIELVYYKKITALSSTNTSNWVLAYHPDLYFYASLQHSAPYLKDDQRLEIWSVITSNLIDQINRESDVAEHSGATLKIRATALE